MTNPLTIDALTSTKVVRLYPHWERKISARWNELLPLIVVWTRNQRELLPDLQHQHHDWLLSLLRLDIEMRVIRRLGLDDLRKGESVLILRRDDHLRRSEHPRYIQRRRPERHAD